MDIKEILKSNDITQQEFAEYTGYGRQWLSTILNKNPADKSLVRKSLTNSLKLLLLEKRGIVVELGL